MKKKKLGENLARNAANPENISITDLELAALQDKLNYLNQKSESLTIKATYDGVVGKISVFSGQYVSAYQPLLSIYHAKPNMVLGFLLEESATNLHVGSVVEVSSYTDPRKVQKGYVANIGQRFIDLPPRLKTTNTATSIAWGREIQITLLDDHTFLPSEKVKITAGTGIVHNYYQKYISFKNKLKNKTGLSPIQITKSDKCLGV